MRELVMCGPAKVESIDLERNMARLGNKEKYCCDCGMCSVVFVSFICACALGVYCYMALLRRSIKTA